MVVDWNSFRESIENTFYNETVNIYEVVDITDGLGAVITNTLKPYLLGVSCNIQNSNRDIVKKEFGMEIDAKYRISLSNDNQFNKDAKYVATLSSGIKKLDESIQYEVESIQPFNTYVLLFLGETNTNYNVVEE